MKSSEMATITLKIHIHTSRESSSFETFFSKEMRFSCLCFTYHHLESQSQRDACHETKNHGEKHPPKQILSLAYITTH